MPILQLRKQAQRGEKLLAQGYTAGNWTPIQFCTLLCLRCTPCPGLSRTRRGSVHHSREVDRQVHEAALHPRPRSPGTGAGPLHPYTHGGCEHFYPPRTAVTEAPSSAGERTRGQELRHAGTCSISVWKHRPASQGRLETGTAPPPGSPSARPGTRTSASLAPSPGAGEQSPPVWSGLCAEVAEPKRAWQVRHRRRINTDLRKPCEDSSRPCPLRTAVARLRHMQVCGRGKRHRARNTPAQARVHWIGTARGNVSSLMTWGGCAPFLTPPSHPPVHSRPIPDP